MAPEDHRLPARARERLRVTAELRAEAAELASRLREAERRLAGIEDALGRAHTELRGDPSPERREELLREVTALEADADAVVERLAGEDADACIEALEIEAGLCADDALRIREAAERLAGGPTEQDRSP